MMKSSTNEPPKKRRHLSLIDDDPTSGLELRNFSAPSPGATSVSSSRGLSHVGMDHVAEQQQQQQQMEEEERFMMMMDARVDCVPILTDEVVVPIDGQRIQPKSYEMSVGGIRLVISAKTCHFLLALGLVVASMGTIWIAKAASSTSASDPPEPPTIQTMEPSAYYKALEAILEPATRNDPHIAKFLNNSTMWNDPMSPQYLAMEWMAFRDHQFLVDQLQDANAVKQRFALVTFFYMANIQLYDDQDSEQWLKPGVSECRFPGITCNARDQVTQLDLVRTAMIGYLPLEMGWLSHLEHVNLQENKLNGGIPEGLLHLTKLTHLDLGSNHMGGPVESLPPNLIYLSLEHNRFQGSIPSFPVSLQAGKLSRNHWSGSLPEFVVDNNLEFLDVVDTHINGTIPTSIGYLTKLQSLSIAQTQLEGELPTQIGLLSSLEEISMGLTNLTGTIPDELFELTELQWLVAVHHQFQGTLSPLIAKLQNLHVINMVHGSLSGPLPTDALASLKNLVWLQLADNEFTGTIGAELASIWTLEKIWLHGNGFQGSIPEELCALPAAQMDFRTDCKSGDLECSCCTLCY